MNANAISPAQPFGSLDELEISLVESYREVSQANHRFLSLLREFDLRQGCKACGNADCAEWLNWKCGISRTTAQEKVRVAKALWNLPQIDEAFARGDLSYSKVRAITRVTDALNEAQLLDYALRTSAADLDIYCSRLRNGDQAKAEKVARRVREGRALYRYFREDGTGTITVDLPREEIELVMQAIERIAVSLPADADRSLFATAADAFVDMAPWSALSKMMPVRF